MFKLVTRKGPIMKITSGFYRNGGCMVWAALAAICVLPSSVLAADYTITSSSPNYLNLGNVGLQPGDTVWIEGHTRSWLTLLNIQGTAENPIIVTNTGGQVRIGNTDQAKGLTFSNCKHVILRGVPGQGYDYGIEIFSTGQGGCGVNFGGGSSDFEIDGVEVHHTGFAGIMAKDDGLKSYQFTMQNIYIHDCYVHDTHGEGMYIGSSFFGDPVKDPHEVHNMEICYNRVENTGWDAIQVGCATAGNNSIHNNVIIGYGKQTSDNAQNEGIRSNPGTAADIYNNWIEGDEGAGTGIFANPYDTVYYYNNVIITPNENGIYIGDDVEQFEGTSIFLFNNTIVSPGYDGIEFRSVGSEGNLVVNNIVANPGEWYLHRRWAEVDVTDFNNLYVPNIPAAGFADPDNGDFSLTAISYAVDAGADLSGYDIVDDWAGTSRPLGEAYDIGALESPYEFTLDDIIIDNLDASVTITGDWSASSATAGYYGTNYLHDQNSGKGSKSVRFTPTIVSPGTYQVYARWTSWGNRANNVPIDIIHAKGVDTVTVNQTQAGGNWRLLGTYDFEVGAAGSVLVRNDGTNGYVIADAVRFVQVARFPRAEDFNDYVVTGFADQDIDGAYVIEDNGATLHLIGNTWKKIALPYSVTENTVIQFDFRCASPGERFGLGMDENNGRTMGRTFQVAGSENYDIQDFHDYTGSDWKTYTIPVGQYYTGDMYYLYFMCDHDIPSPTAEGLYRHIRVYEQ